MTAADFKKIALSLQGTEEGSHMGAVDFRVDGRIFATLAHQDLGYGNLMLTPELQAELVKERPDIFLPIAGGWGRMGSTHIRLKQADAATLRRALQIAWELRVQKNDASKKRPKRAKGK